MSPRILYLLAFCTFLPLACSQEPLVWRPFPDHPGYTREEQISYLQRYPTNYGKVGTIVGEINRVAEEHMDYLVHLAEKKLSYKDLARKSGEELILISAHLTQAILRPCTYDKEVCIPAEVSYITNNIYLDLYRDYENEQNAFCINYTMMHMGIFNGLKERYPSLERYEFIPLGVTRMNHAIQGVYDRDTDRIALMCSLEDDMDGRFNSGKYKLNWIRDPPDLFQTHYH